MAKLGTPKRPIIARVQTMERAEEIAYLCEQNGWIFTLAIEPDQPEDISDVLKLLKGKRPPSPSGPSPRYSRNDYCPCGGEKNIRTAAGIGTIRKGGVIGPRVNELFTKTPARVDLTILLIR